MAAPDDNREGLAAEFALGTLDEGERVDAQRLYDSDAAFAREVEAWRELLGALDGTTAPLEPPNALFGSVLARIGGRRDNVVQLRRQVTLWRIAATGFAAIAAALLLFIAVPGTNPAQPQHFVAVLQSGGTSPAFVASIDVEHGLIGIRRVAAPAAENHSYELWALGAGRKAPQSLGVIDAVARIPTDKLDRLGKDQLRDTSFAISLEPVGGSPTGEPTGPVLFVGKLVPTE